MVAHEITDRLILAGAPRHARAATLQLPHEIANAKGEPRSESGTFAA